MQIKGCWGVYSATTELTFIQRNRRSGKGKGITWTSLKTEMNGVLHISDQTSFRPTAQAHNFYMGAENTVL